MSKTDEDESETVTEEDVIIQTANGERYPAAVIDLTGKFPSDE